RCRTRHCDTLAPGVRGRRRCRTTVRSLHRATPGPPDPMPSTAAPAPATPASGWPPPYLLYLGNAPDHLAAKTARGVAHWRPQWCVGQFRGSNCKTTLGLPDLDFGQAVGAG